MKVAPQSIVKVKKELASTNDDLLAVEEPLEIRVSYLIANEWREKSISVTMRTPGNDFELALGFLIGEGIVEGIGDIENIYHCSKVKSIEALGNVLVVKLGKNVRFDPTKFDRHFYTSSSCGVCGKTSIESLAVSKEPKQQATIKISKKVIHTLPKRLRYEQLVFAHTGGLHASALFDENEKLHYLREDIGRHNTVDKVIGAAHHAGMAPSPLSNCLLVVSGRLGFEIVQKAIMSRIQLIVAIGAPSSLAVKLAEEYHMTLIGFARKKGFNIYSGADRIVD